MTLSDPKPTYCLIFFWVLCQFVSAQDPKGKVQLLSVVSKMKQDLVEVGKSIGEVTNVTTADYFDEMTKWQLLPEATFRTQLFECNIDSGYLAFQPLLFDHIASYLPERVFYATFNTQYVIDNFSQHEQRLFIPFAF